MRVRGAVLAPFSSPRRVDAGGCNDEEEADADEEEEDEEDEDGGDGRAARFESLDIARGGEGLLATGFTARDSVTGHGRPAV